MAQEKLETTPLLRPDSVRVISRPLRRAHQPTLVADLSTAYRRAKRVLDITVSLTALAVFTPLLVLVAALIRLTSPGPALYRQRRVGRGGRIFTMYKFRSMYHDADHTLHRQAYVRFVSGHGGSGKVDRATLRAQAPHEVPWRGPDTGENGALKRCWLRVVQALAPEDPRITPVGALIRRASIDELPQLLNVLLGDMSLVGPRPPIPYEVRLYSPRHLGRLAVTPGVTGLWQVYGRGRVPFEHMVDMDLEYITSRSFWLDLKLLVLTIPTVFFTRGAK
jgi:lipopolysaccharide/colanic/teichoic acid biosynthesis glycosyltransferase